MTSLPNFEQSLSALIAQPSISSLLPQWDQSNLPIIELLASWFEHCGFSISIQAVPHTNNKYNLLAKLGHGDGGLLLAGHSDTVPFDESRWQSDPHKVILKDDKFYGLGTCDMKGFFAFILQACVTLDTKKIKKPLYILATADEEITMAGARFIAQQQTMRPDVAIIGEPTNLVPVVRHKGHMSHRISVKGQSGHSSQPDLGVNAIEIMYLIIGELLSLKDQLKQKFHHPKFDVPYPTLNLGAINGGDNANRICGHCYLDIDLRALPGVSDDELIQMLQQQLQQVMSLYPERITLTSLHEHCSSFEQPKTPFVELVESLSGHSCCSVNYATEAPLIQQLGCQTIVLGPGSIEQAHQPNEFLAASEINKTQQLLTQLIHRYCFT
jgi:acetylornithine deacetylase